MTMHVLLWFRCQCGATKSTSETRDVSLKDVISAADNVQNDCPDLSHVHTWEEVSAPKNNGTLYTLKLRDFYYQTTTQWGHVSCCQGWKTKKEADAVALRIPGSEVVKL